MVLPGSPVCRRASGCGGWVAAAAAAPMVPVWTSGYWYCRAVRTSSAP